MSLGIKSKAKLMSFNTSIKIVYLGLQSHQIFFQVILAKIIFCVSFFLPRVQMLPLRLEKL